MERKSLYLLLVMSLMVVYTGVCQTTFTTTGSSTIWTNTAAWNCSGCGRYPGQSGTTDIVVINNTISFTSGGSNIQVASITINNAALTIGGSNILQVGSVTVNSTGTGTGDFSVWGQSTGSPTVNVTGDFTINRSSTSTNATRLRIGSNSLYATTSTVTIGNDLVYNYNTGGNESNIEISVGNSSAQNDVCTLNVTGSIRMVYNFANDVNNDYLEMRVANNSTVTAGNLYATAGGSATNQRCLVTLDGVSTLVDVSSGDVNVSSKGNLLINGTATTQGKMKAKTVSVSNGSMTLYGASTTLMEVTNPGATAININGTSSASELFVYGDADMTVTGDMAITRNLTNTEAVRFRVGGTTSALSTSVVTINGNLDFNYLNSSASSSEANNEISVGNSTVYSDACQLVVTGTTSLYYNYNGTQSSNVLSFEVGKASSASLQNLTMEMLEGGTGVGCDIRLATNDNLGAQITINGDATLKFSDSSPSGSADVYIKAGNDATTADTHVIIHGNLNMISSYAASSTNNTYVRASGTSYVTIDGDVNFTASAVSGASVENRISLYDNAILNLYGAIVNPLQGSFDFIPTVSSNTTIKFLGSVPQNFPARFGTASSHYKNVVIDNSSGTAFTIPVSTMNVEGVLTMTNGIIASTSSNMLVFEDGATSNGGTTTSYVTGVMQKNGGTSNNALLFPSGSGSHWAPFQVASISGADATTTFQVAYFPTAYSTLTTDGTFASVSNKEYWDVSVSGTVPTATVTAYWKDACFSNVDDTVDPLYLGRFNSGTSQWNKLGNSVVSGNTVCSGTNTGSVSSASVGTYNKFTFIHGDVPLAVEWLYFNAQPWAADYVKLNWATASETTSDYFEVLRSQDAKNFIPLGVVRAAGNSMTVSTYEWIDSTARAGVNYYKLRQVDSDGTESFTKTIAFQLDQVIAMTTVYPNPVNAANDHLHIIDRNHPELSWKVLRILTATGQDVTPSCSIVSAAPHEAAIDMQQVKPGLYLIQVATGAEVKSYKVIVE